MAILPLQLPRKSSRLYWSSLANSLLDGTGNFDQVSGEIQIPSSTFDPLNLPLVRPVSTQSRRHAVMNPPEIETGSVNFPWQQKLATRYARRTIRKSLVRADDQDREGIWHLGPRPCQNMQAVGRARSASRLLGKASSRQRGVEAPPPGGQTDDDDRDRYPSDPYCPGSYPNLLHGILNSRRK